MSILLNGTTQALARTASVIDQNADYTIAGWFSMPAVGSGAFFYYLGSNSGSPHLNMDGGLIQSTTSRVQMNDAAGASLGFVDGGNTFAINTWYYIALRRTGTTLDFIIRNTGGSAAIATAVTASLAGRSAAGLLSIGRRGSNDRYNNTKVAYLRAWTSALTLAQLNAEAVSPTAVVTANLWGSWKLPDNATLTDDSGNGRTLTAVNSPSTSTDTPSDVLIGPTVTTQPTAQTSRLNGDTSRTVTMTMAATATSGNISAITVKKDGVAIANGGVYGLTTSGTGTTSGSVTLTITPTDKTLSGASYTAEFTDSGGTSATSGAVLTVLDGPVLSAFSATTNGSGVASVTMTSDDALSANGELLLITASIGGTVIARTTVRPA